MANEFEERARSKKVMAIVGVLDRAMRAKKLCAYDQALRVKLRLEEWTEPDWVRCARIAGVTVPSAQTRELVIAVYRGRATAPLAQEAS